MIAMVDISDSFAGKPIQRQHGAGAGAVHPITEELVVGVLDPARAQILVREIMRVLEDRKPCHQPRRQRRMPGLVRIDRAEPFLEKAPVDRPTELRQRVIPVDDLVEPRPEEIVLSAVATLLGPHRITLRQADGETESRQNAPINLQEIKLTAATFLQMQRLADPRKRLKNQTSPDSSRTTPQREHVSRELATGTAWVNSM